MIALLAVRKSPTNAEITRERCPGAIEVATWKGPHWSPKPLSVDGAVIRQIPLTDAIYQRIKDTTDYNVSAPPRTAGIQPGKYP